MGYSKKVAWYNREMEWLVIGLLVAILALLAYVLLGRRPGQDTQGLMIQDQIEKLRGTLDTRLAESSRQVSESVRNQLGQSALLIKEITQEITSVKEIGRQTQSFARRCCPT